VIRVSIGVDSTHYLPNTSQSAWYTGESETMPSEEHTDLRSVLTHEFGHATGWSGHYSESYQGVCPETTNRAVMCEPIIRGTSWQRDLQADDVHTFEAAYPGDGGPGPSPTTPPPAPTGLKADLNGDRIPDLLTQLGNGDVYVYPGSGSVNSTTTFWSGTRIGNWSGHTNLALGDLNNDGKADLLSQVASTGDVYVYRGSGSINTSTTFWSPILIGNWANHTNLVLGDLNNDRLPDLLTQIAGQGDLYVYRGSGSVNSSTTFWSGIRVGNWANHTNMALGDLNNDGLTDLLSQVVGSGDVYVYRGSGSVNSSTTFWSPIYIGNWANHTNLVLGDLNRDRLPDLLTQVVGTGDLYVYRGSGSINAGTTFWSSIHIGNWAGHTNLTN
jgi:hypothetical protein